MHLFAACMKSVCKRALNDATVLGGEGQGFCDNSYKAILVNCATMGGGGQKLSKFE